MITIIAGTNRIGSMSYIFAKEISKIYNQLKVKSKILDLAELPLETFSPDAYKEKPLKVLEYTDQILSSYGIVIVVPEYNGSMPGALKLFIDLLPFPESFEGRPVCYVGIASGQFSGLRPVEHLQQVFGYRNAYNFPKRVFVSAVHEVTDLENGITDQNITKRLSEQAEQFLIFCRALGNLH